VPAPDVAVAVLARRRGRRLGGRVKGLIDFGGEPLLARVLRRLAPLSGRSLLVVRERRRSSAWAARSSRTGTATRACRARS